MSALIEHVKVLFSNPASLSDEWRRAAVLIEREANASGVFSLYSRKCAQAAMLRNCADQLDAAVRDGRL